MTFKDVREESHFALILLYVYLVKLPLILFKKGFRIPPYDY